MSHQPTLTPLEAEPECEVAPGEPLLEVSGLAVSFGRPAVEVVRSATLAVHPGETLGLVGESGSGKTVTALALMGLVGLKGGSVTRGTIRFDGEDVTHLDEAGWRQLRGRQIGMVFQQPMRSLNPALTVGEQIAEVVRRHWGWSRKQAWERAVALLDRVQVANAAERAQDYPHQFSGGMAQRVSIAIALACEPKLIIADEPTTALDVTVQSKILELLREMSSDTGVAVIYISHDLAVVAQMSSAVSVMYAGETIESGSVRDVFVRPRHPYTEGLIRSIPRPGVSKTLYSIPGRVPPPGAMPTGCRFMPRCPHAVEGTCDGEPVELLEHVDGHSDRCRLSDMLFLDGWSGR